MSEVDPNSAIDIVRHPRARRPKLSVDPVRGVIRLTIPKRAALAPALRWAEQQGEWIAAQRAALPRPRPFVPGAMIPFGDAVLMVDWAADRSRRVTREGDRLLVGGPVDTVGRRVTAWLKRAALDLLSAETAEFAQRAGVTVSRVATGDPRGRWGSCASSGVIRFSWRLVMAPDLVRRATVAHEVAHRVHMNHGPEFHRLVASLTAGDDAAARRWLRDHGAGLHWLGRYS